MNLARHLKVDAESALRAANAKFRRRFAAMERVAGRIRGARSCSALRSWKQLWARRRVGAETRRSCDRTYHHGREAVSGRQTSRETTIRIVPLTELAQFERAWSCRSRCGDTARAT